MPYPVLISELPPVGDLPATKSYEYVWPTDSVYAARNWDDKREMHPAEANRLRASLIRFCDRFLQENA